MCPCQRTASFPPETMGFRTVLLKTTNLVHFLQCAINLNIPQIGATVRPITPGFLSAPVPSLPIFWALCLPLPTFTESPEDRRTDGSLANLITEHMLLGKNQGEKILPVRMPVCISHILLLSLSLPLFPSLPFPLSLSSCNVIVYVKCTSFHCVQLQMENESSLRS